MDDRLQNIASEHYGQKEFLATLFELAIEEQWFDVQHMVQHDMAKAVIADYGYELGFGFMDGDLYQKHWEEVIEIGWQTFCNHTGLSRDKVRAQLTSLRNNL
jgi:hypothetical protein